MSIWKTPIGMDDLTEGVEHTAIKVLGIEFTGWGDDYMTAKMPVDTRTHQPFGILHGGASVLLAESIGSMAAQYAAGKDKYYCVGQEINANHLRSVSEGWVYATARPVHLGRSSQVWSIEIKDEAGRMVCISRLTMAVLPRKTPES